MFHNLIVCLVLAALAGCAAPPPPAGPPMGLAVPVADVADRLLAEPAEPGRALVYLYRPLAFLGGGSTYRVAFNGVPAADMEIGAVFGLSFPPGRVTIDSWKLLDLFNISPGTPPSSRPQLLFEVSADMVYFVELTSEPLFADPRLRA